MVLTTRPLAQLLVLAGLLVGATRAGAVNPIQAVRGGHFAEAAEAVADYADPVARKLVLYYRLLAENGAGAQEIADFQAANPDWPNQALLEQRRQEAIARESDDAAVRDACTTTNVTAPRALMRCADALAAGGDAKAAIAAARRAWIASPASAADLAGFLGRWKSALRPPDERARFDQLEQANSPEAARQITRLAPADRPAARVRLALRGDAADAPELLAKLPLGERDNPAVVLDEARWLRRNKHEADALALWKAKGEAAEQAASPERRAVFWAERNALARRLLVLGDAAGAYTLADDGFQTGPQAAEAEFLAGFIALRRTGDPQAAAVHFQALAAGKAAITQARAYYWLGRAHAAQGKDAGPDYARAAAYPLTFYGQLAARAAGSDEAELAGRVRALSDPAYNTDAAWSFAGRELVRAAAMLASWGEFGRARAFLVRAQETAPDPVQGALAAHLALALRMPDAAVSIARRMGVQGLALPVAGWPEPVVAPTGPLDPAIVLAVIRQESSFDPGIVSGAGARGLMQLMPATAAVEAQRAGGSVTETALTADPVRNMELGSAYLRTMLAAFGGSLPLAVAAYNAGPHRVEQWLRDNGDPRTGQVDMLDWIELIPFGETRNYVERVLENVVIYQARLGEAASSGLTAQWMR
jgi:soluble lytic murein transglycosylase